MNKLNKLESEGGTAFPFTHKAYSLDYPGMTMRDYFAGEAVKTFAFKFGTFGYDTIARMAYAQADAMIAERSKS